MIQRIQTVYLALVAVFSILGLCLPIGQYYDGSKLMALFNNFVFIPSEHITVPLNWGPIALGILLIFVILLSFLSIMLFHFRMRQLRITIFSTILLVGYVLFYAFLSWKYQLQLSEIHETMKYHLCVAGVFPVISIILNCLAIHSIRKDEALVRSLDRLR